MSQNNKKAKKKTQKSPPVKLYVVLLLIFIAVVMLIGIALFNPAAAFKGNETEQTQQTQQDSSNQSATENNGNIPTSSDAKDVPIIQSKEELDRFKFVLFNNLAKQPTSMAEYHSLKKQINQYGISASLQDDSISRLLELQTKLQTSPVYSVDFDQDSVSDIYELIIMNTSPMARTSREEGKIDGNLIEEVTFYILPTKSTPIIITPLISKYMDNMVNNNLYTSGQYIKIIAKSLASEIRSINFIASSGTDKFTDTITKNKDLDGINYPIGFELIGTTAREVTADVYFYHKNESSTPEDVVIIHNIESGQDETYNYLERDRTLTKMPGKIYKGKFYSLRTLK